MDRPITVNIIGAGISGLSCALNLITNAPNQNFKIVVIEARDVIYTNLCLLKI